MFRFLARAPLVVSPTPTARHVGTHPLAALNLTDPHVPADSSPAMTDGVLGVPTIMRSPPIAETRTVGQNRVTMTAWGGPLSPPTALWLAGRLPPGGDANHTPLMIPTLPKNSRCRHESPLPVRPPRTWRCLRRLGAGFERPQPSTVHDSRELESVLASQADMLRPHRR